MTSTRTARKKRIFLWGLVVLAILCVGAGMPLGYATNQWGLIFFIEILAIVSWTLWNRRTRKSEKEPDTRKTD